jgi:hypothetical protein
LAIAELDRKGFSRDHKLHGLEHQMKRLLFLILTFHLATAFAQNEHAQNFVIDPSKPYVYLKFDHIGSRKPTQKDEGNTGLWLRVVNNCRIPILFLSFTMPDGEAGVGLMDEVIETEPMLQIFTPEEEKEIAQREELRKAKHKPEGYSSETPGVLRVQPGSEILFSVPLNHVDDDWYLRVRFALDLNKPSASVGPFTYLPFYKWDIPREQRRGSATQLR